MRIYIKHLMGFAINQIYFSSFIPFRNDIMKFTRIPHLDIHASQGREKNPLSAGAVCSLPRRALSHAKTPAENLIPSWVSSSEANYANHQHAVACASAL